jgi:endonuclease-3 related protein
VKIYNLLLRHFGPQHWWPGRTGFEIIIGAILTQNTNWTNVEKAISNLRRRKLLNLKAMLKADKARLLECIRPSGYYNQKQKKIENFLDLIVREYKGSVNFMNKQGISTVREKLLDVNGIGPETADSILLYALNKKVFVVDAYTKRILLRHNMAEEKADYHEIQRNITDNFPKSLRKYNEFHALLVRTGKEFCKKTNPLCEKCPINGIY